MRKFNLKALLSLWAALVVLLGLLPSNCWASSPQTSKQLHSSEDSSSQIQQHPFMHRAVLIDVGHGGIDGGTSFQGLLEKDINLAISRRLYMLLRSEGIPAVLNRDQDYALSDDNRWHASRSRHQRDLSQRKQLSHEIPTAMIVSIHVNWAKNSSRSGGIVLHQPEGRSTLLAGCIQRQFNELYQLQHTFTVGKPFYLLKLSEVPAVIVETGFISHPSDRQKLTSRKGQVEISEAIVKGIISYLTMYE
ncbi:N-acetylmuramoyl-L-alanine amidase [Paenibacillus algicola]|uniref:N-acetylmuramoyl-L-alanine amidase n=1 Tax=Paenibacillus algicola TaxID=2565926 RepID=A0A4P8XLR2_9BACL|nr:N-acetylmuramoyl-L-alanine amidase [Paenibacillus algicola]QCT03438.1 N-acetylmuramoyl-L-alanine amidase [Paenibacillus algicola]